MYNAQLKRLDALTARASARASAAAGAGGSAIVAALLTLGPLNGTTTVATDIAAFDVTPTKGGLYLVGITASFVLSAADAGVAWVLLAVPAVTAISGGAVADTNFHYETTGSPLVVTGGTPVAQYGAAQEIATGQIAAQNQVILAAVQLAPTPTRQAIVLAVQTTGGAHLTTLGVANAFAIEL